MNGKAEYGKHRRAVVIMAPPSPSPSTVTLLDRYEVEWITKEIDRVIAKGGKTSRSPLVLPRVVPPVVDAGGCSGGGIAGFIAKHAMTMCGGGEDSAAAGSTVLVRRQNPCSRIAVAAAAGSK